jgi:putative FmdB family regulatory protein
MATYQYHCLKCSNIFNVVKKMAEYDRQERCECGEVAERKPGVPLGVIYKTGGFTKRHERNVDKEIQDIIAKEAPQNGYDPMANILG